jgi:hypothetical protein
MKTRKYVKVKGNELIVGTPIPYIIVRQYEHETSESAKNKEYSLNSSCKFFYDILKLLGISKKEAKRLGYTLNLETGIKVLERASKVDVSHEVFMLIKNHRW